MEATMSTKELVIYLAERFFGEDSDSDHDVEAVENLIGFLLMINKSIKEVDSEEAIAA
jgi:hypothetical protein